MNVHGIKRLFEVSHDAVTVRRLGVMGGMLLGSCHVRARVAGAVPRKAAREELLREHFDTLAALFDPGTFDRIVQLGIGPGWQCWEVGAGGGSVTGWLAERVGDSGRVVATDVDVWALASSRGVNVEMLRHDLGVEDAPGSGFDLVHARLVLEHVYDYAAGLAAMAGALRPGGWLHPPATHADRAAW
jgi:2-polyprenyl-3-methyl-5-hydroxy-6-metoxy-1,4-benzoquinol methylase